MLLILRRVFLVCLLATLGACASGPKFNEVKSAIPAMSADQGRIYVYRPGSMVGAAIQPEVLLNGEKVGESKPGGFFYIDRPAGNYEVACSTEVERKVGFVLEKGQVRYIKTSIGMGFLVGRVHPELMDPTEGQTELETTSYIGAPLPAAK
ncbi:MAG: uncharacterized protein JWN73_4163 [Betaproteobacteria bacterium]|nr:uncharacterized protein [Betaproteobacteria bacterium]